MYQGLYDLMKGKTTHGNSWEIQFSVDPKKTSDMKGSYGLSTSFLCWPWSALSALKVIPALWIPNPEHEIMQSSESGPEHVLKGMPKTGSEVHVHQLLFWDLACMELEQMGVERVLAALPGLAWRWCRQAFCVLCRTCSSPCSKGYFLFHWVPCYNSLCKWLMLWVE